MAQPGDQDRRGTSSIDGSSTTTKIKHWSRDWQCISCSVAVALLLLAVKDTSDVWNTLFGDASYTLDEPFFQFLKIYVTGLALFVAFTFGKLGQALVAVPATLLVILFNPVIPIEIEDWTLPYAIAAGGFGFLAAVSPSVNMGRSRKHKSLKLPLESSAACPSTFQAEPKERGKIVLEAEPKAAAAGSFRRYAQAFLILTPAAWFSGVWLGILQPIFVGALAATIPWNTVRRRPGTDIKKPILWILFVFGLLGFGGKYGKLQGEGLSVADSTGSALLSPAGFLIVCSLIGLLILKKSVSNDLMRSPTNHNG